MFKKLKHLTKEFLIFLVIFSLVCWSVSIPLTNFIKDTKAAGGIELMYFDDGGATHDVYLNSIDTPEAFLKITAYETEGTNTLDSITINLDQAMNCSGSTCTVSPFAITDLSDLSATANSGLSLWLDNGDGDFDSSTDSLLSDTSPPSDWTTPADPCPPPDNTSNTFWQTTFTNLNLNIPATFNERLTVFVVALAKENLNASTLHKFMPFIPYNGINISATDSGASIADMPTETCGWMFMPVTLGDEGSGDNIMYGAPIVISEIQTAGANSDDEFIELYNRTPDAIDISSWSIQYRNTESNTINKVDLGETNIPGNGFYLITHATDYDGGVAGDTTYSASMALDTASGTLFLINNQITLTTSNIDTSTSTVDKVAWGTGTNIHPEGTSAPAPPANGSLERKAYPSSTPSTMVGGVDSTRGNSSDTYNNSADFIVRSASDGSDPQNTSSAAETDMVTAADRDIVINEILYNTSSGNSWIEIYNASSTAINISEWRLIVFATSSAQTYMVPAGHFDNFGNLAAGSFVVVHWNSSGTDTATDLYGNMGVDMSVYGGDITLDDGSYIYDYIQFGGSGKGGEAAAVSAGKWTTGDYIYNSNYNESIARQGTAGDDYNSSVDWMYMSSPTQGYPNIGGDSTAPSEVTNVILTDSDNANYGLDGYDVRVTWSPANAQDSSFDRYELYVLPESVSLDASQHSAYAMLYGQYYYESGTASTSYVFTGYSDFTMTMDSAGTTLSCGSNYRAYVVAVDFSGNRSSAVGSASATLTSDAGGSDTVDPMIDHMGVWEARVNQDLTIYARMSDDRDQCNLATAELAYKVNTDAWGTATSTCTRPAMSGNTCLYACPITWNGAWGDTTTIYYYLRAADNAGNWTFVSMTGYVSTESAVQNDVYTSSTNNCSGIDFVATGSWDDAGTVADITGIIYDESGNLLQDAFVIIEGVATTTATTTSAGVFTFPDNALRHPWADIRILKSGYMNEMRTVQQNGSSTAFYLYDGYMSMGAGGSAGGNGVMSTAPFDMTMMAPTDISCSGNCSTLDTTHFPIVIWFFNDMNATTIDDMDASNSGSNIYITSDGNTKIPGRVTYASSDKSARFYSDTALSYDTFYTVVITPNVKDTNGNPIEANRANGNYEFSFSTMPDNSTMWGSGGTDYSGFGGGGMMMPPYVVGTNPTPGSYDVPLGAILTVEFSEPMTAASISSSIKINYPRSK
ncbi:lamin tail domain-containing protein, partial [Candidatus Parcubacteria bacterium]|nr:lamin tail domain-containing protein [Candidatus Parcubacteria bacterium]